MKVTSHAFFHSTKFSPRARFAVIDYRGKTPDQLAHAIGDALDGQGSSAHYAFDCISTADSVRTLGKALAHQGGYLTTVLESAEEAVAQLPTSVTHVGRTAVRTAHGENAAFADRLYKQLGAWVEEGKFRGSKVGPSASTWTFWS